MDFNAAHTSFVVAAYAVSGLCLVGLIAHVLRLDLKFRKLKPDA
jgi:heme exporter protein CcmD